MRVLVCGSREWNEPEVVSAFVGGFFGELCVPGADDLVVIEGGARGADRAAAEFAKRNPATVRLEEYPAKWDEYGKRAGMVRNKQMLDEGKPDVVLAFGYGRGTDMMVDLALAAGLPVYRVLKESA